MDGPLTYRDDRPKGFDPINDQADPWGGVVLELGLEFGLEIGLELLAALLEAL